MTTMVLLLRLPLLALLSLDYFHVFFFFCHQRTPLSFRHAMATWTAVSLPRTEMPCARSQATLAAPVALIAASTGMEGSSGGDVKIRSPVLNGEDEMVVGEDGENVGEDGECGKDGEDGEDAKQGPQFAGRQWVQPKHAAMDVRSSAPLR